jgi:hypothetical protein
MAFGVLCATERQEVVRQLLRALGRGDDVFVHHDFSKQPVFDLAGTGAHVIADPVVTGWGTAGFCGAIFHLLRTALRQSDFDYLQLLSGNCLPLKPIAALKAHLERSDTAIHAELIALDRDERAMLSHGHRAYCRDGRPLAGLLRRSRRWYLGPNPVTRQQANLGIEDRSVPATRLQPIAWAGRQIHRAARAGLLDRHPFGPGFAAYIGSTWFCLRRDACEYLVAQEHSHAALPYLLELHACDEILFPTLLGNSGLSTAPSMHVVNDFSGLHPQPFSLPDLARLERSDRFFGRKFRDDAHDPVRTALLRRHAVRPTHQEEAAAA